MKKIDWWTRKALSLLEDNHVFVVTFHYCPYIKPPGSAIFARKYGIYNTQTGQRVPGLGRLTFWKLRRRLLDKPVHVPMFHPPCPKQLRRGFPPDMVYTLK